MYLTLNSVKTYLTVAGNTQDDQITDMMQTAEAWIKEYLNHDPESKERIEVVDGNGLCSMFLKEFPVTELKSIECLGDDNTTWLPIACDRKVFYEDGQIRLSGGYFPKGYQNIRITYTAGYSPMHPMIIMAGKQLCLLMYKDSPVGGGNLGVTSKVKGTNGTQFQENIDKQALRRVLDQIARFRKVHA